MDFPFNYGLGPYGCSGQSVSNCGNSYNDCCRQPSGPVMTAKVSSSVGFREMSPFEKSSWVLQSRSVPPSARVQAPLPQKKVPAFAVGIL